MIGDESKCCVYNYSIIYRQYVDGKYTAPGVWTILQIISISICLYTLWLSISQFILVRAGMETMNQIVVMFFSKKINHT